MHGCVVKTPPDIIHPIHVAMNLRLKSEPQELPLPGPHQPFFGVEPFLAVFIKVEFVYVELMKGRWQESPIQVFAVLVLVFFHDHMRWRRMQQRVPRVELLHWRQRPDLRLIAIWLICELSLWCVYADALFSVVVGVPDLGLKLHKRPWRRTSFVPAVVLHHYFHADRL